MADPFDFNEERVLANIRRASTEDLLNRATVFRDGMEPQALDMIERELASRGISAGTIEQHEIQQRQQVIIEQDGRVAACSYCELPAVAEGWGWWYILWGVLPIFPRFVRYCREHRPVVPEGNPEATEDKGLQED